MRPLLAAALAALSCGCAGVPRSPLPPAGFARSTARGDLDGGAVDVQVGAEIVTGRQVHVPVRFTAAVDDRTSAWLEWLPFGLKDRGGAWSRSASADLTYGVHHRLGAGVGPWPALTIETFGVAPHGGPKAARWPGVVDGEDAYFGLAAAEWGDSANAVVLNLGGGVAGRSRSAGRAGRVLGTLGYTRALPPTGIDWSTEPTRIGIETFWAWDPVDDREFGELNIGLSIWLGVVEINAGYRRGLTDETPDDVVYLGFRARGFEMGSL